MCPKRKDGDILALLHNTAFADLEHVAARGHGNPCAVSTRIAKGDRASIMRRCRGHHMHQLGLIRGSHHGKPRQIAQIGDIKRPRMRGPIGPNQTRAVNCKTYRQTLQRHIMNHLIIAALQKG